MKKVIILMSVLIFAVGCKKNGTETAEPQTNFEIKVFGSSTTNVYIDNSPVTFGFGQNITVKYILKKGQTVKVIDNGFDTTYLNPNGTVAGTSQGAVVVKILSNNTIVFNQSCLCNVDYTYTVN